MSSQLVARYSDVSLVLFAVFHARDSLSDESDREEALTSFRQSVIDFWREQCPDADIQNTLLTNVQDAFKDSPENQTSDYSVQGLGTVVISPQQDEQNYNPATNNIPLSNGLALSARATRYGDSFAYQLSLIDEGNDPIDKKFTKLKAEQASIKARLHPNNANKHFIGFAETYVVECRLDPFPHELIADSLYFLPSNHPNPLLKTSFGYLSLSPQHASSLIFTPNTELDPQAFKKALDFIYYQAPHPLGLAAIAVAQSKIFKAQALSQRLDKEMLHPLKKRLNYLLDETHIHIVKRPSRRPLARANQDSHHIEDIQELIPSALRLQDGLSQLNKALNINLSIINITLKRFLDPNSDNHPQLANNLAPLQGIAQAVEHKSTNANTVLQHASQELNAYQALSQNRSARIERLLGLIATIILFKELLNFTTTPIFTSQRWSWLNTFIQNHASDIHGIIFFVLVIALGYVAYVLWRSLPRWVSWVLVLGILGIWAIE